MLPNDDRFLCMHPVYRASITYYRVGRDGAPVLSPGQCLSDDHFIGFRQRLREIKTLRAVDENSDMATDAALFVDHAEANAGVLAFQVVEQSGEGRTVRVGAH